MHRDEASEVWGGGRKEEGEVEPTTGLEVKISHLQKMMKEVEARAEGKRPMGRLMLDEDSPLLATIMATILPHKYFIPHIVYDGRAYPNHHVERFNKITSIQGLNDYQRCQVFPLTLERQAREWYRRLESGSVNSCKELCELFAVHFWGSCETEQDTISLKKLKQRESESLRAFVTRYHRAVTNLGAFDHPDALEGLKKGLRINILWNNLYDKGIGSYAAAYDQVKLDMKIEDTEEEKKRSEGQRVNVPKIGDRRSRQGD